MERNSELRELLEAMASSPSNERELLVGWLPRFLSLVDVTGARLRYEFVALASETRLRVWDAALIAADNAPVLGIEVFVDLRRRWTRELVFRQMREQKGATGIPYLMIFSNSVLLFIDLHGDEREISIEHLDETDLGFLSEWFAVINRELMMDPSEPDTEERESPCVEALRELDVAGTSHDKGVRLEEFVANRINEASGLRVKHRNLRTASSEIDLVVEELGSPDTTALREFGRHFLIECKNWERPAGAKEVRDFVGKLLKTQATLGILVSKLGVTGQDGSEDALREIRFCYDHLGKAVVVLSMQDLELLCDGHRLTELIDAKVDRLRFDLQ